MPATDSSLWYITSARAVFADVAGAAAGAALRDSAADEAADAAATSVAVAGVAVTSGVDAAVVGSPRTTTAVSRLRASKLKNITTEDLDNGAEHNSPYLFLRTLYATYASFLSLYYSQH